MPRASWIALLASFGVAAGAPAAAPAPLAVSEVAAGEFVHTGRSLALDAPGHDDIANVGFIVGTRCVAVIDSGGSPRIGRALRAALRSRTQLPVCYVINTHVHVDHILGDVAFRDDHPHFVGHVGLAAALTRSRDFFLQNYRADFDSPADAAQISMPDVAVAPGHDLHLDLGQRELLLQAWPRAHTDCDLTVFDTATATLWTGDLLFVGRTPALDGSLKGWLAVDVQLAQRTVKHVVPGHGPVGSDLAAALAPQQRYLRALLEGVRGAIAAGKPLQEASRAVQPPHGGWQLWDATHPRNVARAYQELEWE